MRLHLVVRDVSIVLGAGLLAFVAVYASTNDWSQRAVIAALLGVCAFLAWWDHAVVGRRTWGPAVVWAMFAVVFVVAMWTGRV